MIEDHDGDALYGEMEEEEEDDEVSEAGSQEFNEMMNIYQNEFKGRGQGYSNRLPKNVNSLLGDANKLYLEKNFDLAIEKCFETIKIFPENPEPYHLLSVIYEEKGDKIRAVDFLFMETQSNYKSDIHSWRKLADSYYKLESFKYAGYCYGRALKCEKNNVELLLNKAQCYDKLKDARGAIKYYEKIYNLLNGNKEVLMKLGKLYSKVEQHQKAILLMIDFLAKNTEDVDMDIANVVCELLMSKGKHKECCIFIELLALNSNGLKSIQSIRKFYQQAADSYQDNNDSLERIFEECRTSKEPGSLRPDELRIMKDEIPVEILVKYCSSHMRLSDDPKKREVAMAILSFVESFDSTEYVDEFIDVIDLYCEHGFLQQAIRICQKIYSSESNEDKPLILLRMGYLYGKMGDRQSQVDSYKRALLLDPNNKKARYKLSEIYQEDGQISDAIHILGNNAKTRIDQLNDLDEDDEIYLSDDDAMLGKRQDQEPPEHRRLDARSLQKNQKVDKLIKDIKEEGSLNVKTRKRMMNIVELNENFFINVQSRIDEIMEKYDLDILLLNFKQCELSLASADDTLLIDFKCIKKTLRLEQQKVTLREDIYKLLLNENKGKIRSAFEEISQEDLEMKKGLTSLFIFKRKKKEETANSRIDNLYKESKNKSRVAKKLAQKVIGKMKTIPDYVGGMDRFIEVVEGCIKIMYQQKKFAILAQICEILFKISKSFDQYPSFQVSYFFYGFLSSCRVENYEKAYLYFRVISKHLIVAEDGGLTPLHAKFLEKFRGYNMTDVNKICICMINHLFNQFNHSSEAHHNFFQKLQKQYESNKKVQFYMNILSCNNYIMTGSYIAARECLKRNGNMDDRLTSFLLAFINLVDSTNRNNENKIESIHLAFENFEKYKLLSTHKLCEVYYNMGRAFTHLNLQQSAVTMFNKCIDIVNDKVSNLRTAAARRGAEDGAALDGVIEQIRVRNMYYEATFNILVWNSITNNTAQANDFIKTLCSF